MKIYNNTEDSVKLSFGDKEVVCEKNKSVNIDNFEGILTIRPYKKRSFKDCIRLIKYETLTTTKKRTFDFCYYTEFETKVFIEKGMHRISIEKNSFWLYNHIVFSLFNVDKEDIKFDYASKTEKNMFYMFFMFFIVVYWIFSSILFFSMLYWVLSDFEIFALLGLALGLWLVCSCFKYTKDMLHFLKFNSNYDILLEKSSPISIFNERGYMWIERLN